MFKWKSKQGKDVCKFLFWFYIFTYIPVVPAYFIMSLRGLLGLSALVYVALSMFLIYKMYIRVEKNNNLKKSMVAM